MEGSLESGVYLETLGLTRYHKEEEDCQEIQRFMERDEGPYHRSVYL